MKHYEFVVIMEKTLGLFREDEQPEVNTAIGQLSRYAIGAFNQIWLDPRDNLQILFPTEVKLNTNIFSCKMMTQLLS